MIIRQNIKKIVFLLIILFSILITLFGIINSSLFQKKIFNLFSKNINENHSILLESNNFYYNIFSNKISCNFLILDHFQNPMINIPNISIGFNNNIIFSKSDIKINNVNIENVDFFIKKYESDSITNFELFINKISNENSTNLDSLFIENINLSISNFILQNQLDTIKLNDFSFDLNKIKYSNNNGCNIENIFFQKNNSFFASSLNQDKSNNKFFVDIIDSKFYLKDFINQKLNNNDFINFSSILSFNKNIFSLEKLNINYNQSFLDGIFSYDSSLDLYFLQINNSIIKKQDLLSFSMKNKIDFPSLFLDLGDIKYIGKTVLYNRNLDIESNINSDYGFSNLNIKFHFPDSLNNPSFDGTIDFNKFNLGSLLNFKNLGEVNFKTKINGSGLDKDNFFANISFQDAKIFFDNYYYNNLSLNADLSYNLFRGDLRINDRNCKVQLNGELDFSDNNKIINVSSKVKKINLDKIKLLTGQPIKQFSGNIIANLKGNSIDDLIGSIEANKLSYYRGKKYNLNNLKIDFNNSSVNKSLLFKSDIGSAFIIGDFKYLDLKKDFKNIFLSFLKNEKKIFQSNYNLDLDLDFNNSSFITDFFLDNFSLENFKLKINKKKLGSNLFINGDLDSLSFNNNFFDNLNFDFKVNDQDKLNFHFLTNNFINTENNLNIDSLVFTSNSRSDQIEYNLLLKNINKNESFDASFFGNISRGEENLISFSNSFVNFPDQVWNLSPNSLIKISNFDEVNFSNFSLSSGSQLIDVSVENSNSLKLFFDLKNVDLELINFLRKKDASRLAGLADGTFWYSSVSKPVGGYLKVKDFSINDVLLGDLILNTQSNNKRKFLVLDGYVKPSKKSKTIEFNGTVSLDKKNSMNMFLNFNGQDCNILNPYISSISNNKGNIYGNLNLYGPYDNYFIDGSLTLNNFSFKIPYLNTSYLLKNDYSVSFKKDNIQLDSVLIHDKKFNTNGLFYGEATHANALKEISYNLFVSSDNLYCLNTKIENNDIYYGEVFVGGNIIIDGEPNKVYLEIDAESKKGTKFNIPLSTSMEISEENNLELFNSLKSSSSINIFNDKEKNNKDFNMNFDLSLTPNAQVQIIYDEKIGDIIKGSGEGDLKLEIDDNGNFNMYGEILINQGEYLYTMQNVLNKNFILEKGGSLFWNGSPYDINIDFFAIYELKTSLNLLDADYNSSTKVPVFCKMHMTNNLLNPSVDFIIDIPSASDVALTKLYQLTDTEEKKLQQFLFLIGANSFLIQESTENYLNSSLTTTGTELLSNQISNWLSQITDDFDLGFRWTPGSTDSLTTDEIQLALSMKLLNDKLTINGNASNPSTPQAQDNTDIVGELDIQYELSDNFKLKAFNRTDEYDPISGDEFRYEQGVSIFFEKEFDNFFDIFRKKKKRKKN